MKKIITCAGYHGTGSSVITDLLKEFKSVESFGEFEFRFLQDPNGVGSLEDVILRNNCRLNSDRGIYEFLRLIKKLNNKKGIIFFKKNNYRKVFSGEFQKISEEYIKELTDLKWKGWWHDFIFRDRDLKELINYKIKRIFFCLYKLIKLLSGKEVLGGIKEDFYFSNKTENDFIEITQNYLELLWSSIKTDKEILCFDQLVPVIGIKKYLRYFKNLKVIVIDRDPRDLYILNKVVWRDNVVPVEDVNIFIKYFLLLRSKRNERNEDVLELKFEDCIYKYEDSLEKIQKFLNLNPKDHIYQKKYFDPNISINNTQLYLLYPELKNDILKIEKELSEYCYNFPYLVPNDKNKIF